MVDCRISDLNLIRDDNTNRRFVYCKFRATDDDSNHFGERLLAIDADEEMVVTVAEIREAIIQQFSDVESWKIDNTIFIQPWLDDDYDIERTEESNIRMLDILEMRRSSGEHNDPFWLMVRREVHHTYFELEWVEGWDYNDSKPTVIVESEVAVDMTLADLRREIDLQVNLPGVVADFLFWGINNAKRIERSEEEHLSATNNNRLLPPMNRRETPPPTYSVRLMTSPEPIV